MNNKKISEVDMHIHSNYSDGDCDVDKLVNRIMISGLKVAVLTDHDCIDGLNYFSQKCEENGIETITGVEFTTSTVYLEHKINEHGSFFGEEHILGYGFDIEKINEHGRLLMNKNRFVRRSSMASLINLFHLEGCFSLNIDQITEMFKLPTEAHTHYWLARAMALEMMTRKINEGSFFLDLINKAYKEIRKFLDFSSQNLSNVFVLTGSVIDAIKKSAGFAVWAHPLKNFKSFKRYDVCDKKLQKMFEEKLLSFKNSGLDGVEINSSDNTEEENNYLFHCCKEYGLMSFFGGSDYHGDGLCEQKPERYLGMNGVDYEKFLYFKEYMTGNFR